MVTAVPNGEKRVAFRKGWVIFFAEGLFGKGERVKLSKHSARFQSECRGITPDVNHPCHHVMQET